MAYQNTLAINDMASEHNGNFLQSVTVKKTCSSMSFVHTTPVMDLKFLPLAE
jgi:hypothetical protein